jgi:hypothetical protein
MDIDEHRVGLKLRINDGNLRISISQSLLEGLLCQSSGSSNQLIGAALDYILDVAENLDARRRKIFRVHFDDRLGRPTAALLRCPPSSFLVPLVVTCDLQGPFLVSIDS